LPRWRSARWRRFKGGTPLKV